VLQCQPLLKQLEHLHMLGHVVQRTYNLPVIWDVHPPKTQNTQEGLCFLFAGWCRHSCYVVDDINWDMMAPILPFYSPKLDLLRRSLDFTSFNGETGFQKDLDCFLSFLKNFLCCVTPYNDVINVLQMSWSFTLFQCVLGLARTGLIFTRIQEGAQLGGLTQSQNGQREPGIPYHVPSCWVPVGGAARWELTRGLGGLSGGAVRESGSVLRALFCGFVQCNSLFCIFAVPVPFVCCSVKLPLSRPTSFCLFSFHSSLHPGGGRGGLVALLLPAAENRTLHLVPNVGWG